ncbi:GspH/FimT family pseudopilin [Pseudoxanthomonas koreensis]|uniref:GspH/FimT family pseudopilin n=1 Tax=Pseudoxanthomonas koreensis TaxID=266061 RepID=UPI0035A65432
MPFTRQNGFSVIELMVVVAIVAILAALAFPSFQASIRSNRVATTSNEVLASLSLARTEAIKGVGVAGVCPSSNGTSCSSTTDWAGGWMVWRTDATGAGTVQTPVRYIQAKDGADITGPADGVSFTVQGRVDGTATQFGVKPKGVDTPARCVSVNVTGQARVTQEACS